eukprot:scaffold40857_cov33-Phaeocystis_antarctica.AAC.1
MTAGAGGARALAPLVITPRLSRHSNLMVSARVAELVRVGVRVKVRVRVMGRGRGRGRVRVTELRPVIMSVDEYA